MAWSPPYPSSRCPTALPSAPCPRRGTHQGLGFPCLSCAALPGNSLSHCCPGEWPWGGHWGCPGLGGHEGLCVGRELGLGAACCRGPGAVGTIGAGQGRGLQADREQSWGPITGLLPGCSQKAEGQAEEESQGEARLGPGPAPACGRESTVRAERASPGGAHVPGSPHSARTHACTRMHRSGHGQHSLLLPPERLFRTCV